VGLRVDKPNQREKEMREKVELRMSRAGYALGQMLDNVRPISGLAEKENKEVPVRPLV